ncbi:MAG: hypothetical protein R2715_05305 [Ilumatobacteraceae bacterium]
MSRVAPRSIVTTLALLVGLLPVLAVGAPTPASALVVPDTWTTIAGDFRGPTLVIMADGRVLATGTNTSGQLGDGTTTPPTRSWTQVLVDDAIEVASGSEFGLVLRADGTLWGFGSNRYGQLGDVGPENQPAPVQIMSEVAHVAAGNTHTVVLKRDGSVWTFGRNRAGQLGDGSLTGRSRPQQVMDSAALVFAGAESTYALDRSGKVWSWGSFYVVGRPFIIDGVVTSNSLKPGVVMEGVVRMTAGSDHAVVITDAGEVWAWGSAFNNQLPGFIDPTSDNRAWVPTQLPDADGAIATRGATYLIASDGSVSGSGTNFAGTLGTGAAGNWGLLARVPHLDDVIGVATAGGGGGRLFLQRDGTVWVAGYAGFAGASHDRNYRTPIRILTGAMVPGGATPGPAPSDCTIFGTDGDDVLLGTEGDDVICAFGGDDLVAAFGGNDIVFGGEGDDSLYGGSGDDLLIGGLGADHVWGGDGNDAVFGGVEWQQTASGGPIPATADDQPNVVGGGDGIDLVVGDAGDDTLYSGPGETGAMFHVVSLERLPFLINRDTLLGGARDDLLAASTKSAAVELQGGDGNDRLVAAGMVGVCNPGGGGSFVAIGGEGNDQVWGSTGCDTIFGNAGDDTLRTGTDSVVDRVDGGVDDDRCTVGSEDISAGCEH